MFIRNIYVSPSTKGPADNCVVFEPFGMLLKGFGN